MLVLSRKADETIVFPELGISVEVIRVKGSVVRLGIKAPDSVRILRGELEAVVNEFEDDRSFAMAASTQMTVCAAPNAA
jgi:carbon storage regulator